MFYYSIIIQFAKANAPKFTDIMALINNAIEVYNAKSLMAANPKQIVELNLKDDMTIEVILESTQELQEAMASKALRVFSSYLISDDVDGNLSNYITGKRLFKMMPSKLSNYSKGNKETVSIITSPKQKDAMDITTQAVLEFKTTNDGIDYISIENWEIDEALMFESLAKLLQKARTDRSVKIRAKRINNQLQSFLKKQEA